MDVKEKLVELMKEAKYSVFPNITARCTFGVQLPYSDRILRQVADHLIAHSVTVQEWISVKDGLPEIYDKEPDWSVTVLFRTIQGHIHSGYRNIGRPQKSFYDDDWTPPYWLDESENLSFEEDVVTHWMPLPQPPI